MVQDYHQNGAFGLFFFAVHGFRMPLFFLLSGFFTAMLWRKRGLKSLIRQRFRRVFLPCMLGVITVVPAVNWISWVAMKSATQKTREPALAEEVASDFWTVLRKGNIAEIEKQIAGGVDVNSRDEEFGVTPLCWAALLGQTETVKLLIQKGAKVDGRNNDGATPLHAASFLGHTEIAARLIEEGADVDATNNQGQTALESSKANWQVTRLIASLLRIEIDMKKVKEGRSKTAELLRVHGAGEARKDNVFWGVALWLIYIPVFHHLWFLWFLCWLVAAFAVFAAIAGRVRWKGPHRRWILSPLRFLWLLPLTMIPQAFFDGFGADTSTGLLPAPHILAYYAIFFFFGALYWDSDDVDGQVGRWWRFTLPFGLLVLFPLGLEFSMGSFGFRDQIAPSGLHRPLSIGLQVIYVWTMTFAFMGLFRKLLPRENKTIRYLSDSSYWLYLVHLPLIIAGQLVVRDWNLPAVVKFGLICVVVSMLLLLTYQTIVRYTWLGTLLNGPRMRPAKATAREGS